MKNTKRILSLVLSALMLIGCVSVSAAYPTTLLTPPTSVSTESELGNVGNDNSAYAFTYKTVNAPEGASFVLLDKDETTGEYLMATNQLLVKDTFNFDNDLSNGWQYDPTDESNVAYWVNTYLHNGTSGRALHYIGKIRDYIVEKQWKIEASEAQSLPERTITAKAVLPSYTEYKTYRDKLNSSKAFTNTGWYYVWLRTPSNDMSGTQATKLMLQVSTANSAADGTGLLGRRAPDSGSANSGIQLFFWVNEDFFKSEKVGNIGTAVKAQLVADYEKSELASLYTEEELIAMGFEADVSAEISNVNLSTNINAPGGTATVTYDIEPAGASAAVAYYTCDADGSSPVKLDGVSGTTAKIPSSAGGKYFCAGVTSGSTTVYSAPVQIAAALPTYDSLDDLSAWILEYNDPDYMFSTSYTNFTLLEEDGDEVVLLADRVDQGTAKARPDNGDGGLGINTFDPTKNEYLPKYMKEGILSNDTTPWSITNSKWQKGNVYGLPTSMVPYVNTKAMWRTEGFAAADLEEYVFESAATLPSATEVLKYKDRIGIKGASSVAAYNSWSTRTPYVLNNGNVQVFGTYGNTAAEAQKAPLYMSSNAYPRFIFRLNKEFFKNQKLYVSNATDVHKKLVDMGSKVKEMLVNNFAKSEIASAGYTEDELTAIGFTGSEPVVSGVSAQGIASVAQTLTADYVCDDATSVEYQWYYADTATGDLNKITGATAATYVVTDDMLGKYIAVSVRVTNAGGIKSAAVKSGLVGPIAERADIVVTPVIITSTNAVFTIDNAAANKAMVILYCVYNKADNSLAHVVTEDITAKTGKDTYSASLPTTFTVTANHKVKAMVWDNLDNIRPYSMIELK